MNRLKILILSSALTALVLWVGEALGGQTGLVFAVISAGLMSFGAYPAISA